MGAEARETRVERMAREMLLAGASGRRGWCREADMALRRRRMASIARDVAAAVAAIGIFALLLWAAARGLDGEEWQVGDYANAPTWQDMEVDE